MEEGQSSYRKQDSEKNKTILPYQKQPGGGGGKFLKRPWAEPKRAKVLDAMGKAKRGRKMTGIVRLLSKKGRAALGVQHRIKNQKNY